MAARRSLREIIEDLTWEDILADGIVRTDEIEASIVAAGEDPRRYDHLYD